MNSILEGISEKLKEDSDGWGAAIGGAAIGGAVAMLLGGPLTWLVGGGAMIAKWLFSEEKTEAQKRKEAMSKNLSADERISVCNSISEKWDDLCTSVENSIRKAINDDASIRESILQVSSTYMQAYKESLKSARILVD